MGRETKIGLVVIGSLLLVFGGVLYWQLSKGTESTDPASAVTAAVDSTKSKFSSALGDVTGDAKSTVLSAKSAPLPGSSGTPNPFGAPPKNDDRYGSSSGFGATMNKGIADANTAFGKTTDKAVELTNKFEQNSAGFKSRYDTAVNDAKSTLSAAGDSVAKAKAAAGSSLDSMKSSADDAVSATKKLAAGVNDSMPDAGSMARFKSNASNSFDSQPKSSFAQPRSSTTSVDPSVDLATTTNPLRGPRNEFDAVPAAAEAGTSAANTQIPQMPSRFAAPAPVTTPAPAPAYSTPPRSAFPPTGSFPSASANTTLPSASATPRNLPNGTLSRSPLPADAPRNGDKYTVQPNDTYWLISQKAYNDGGYFKAIYAYNRRVTPRADRLAIGDTLTLPHESVLQKEFPDLCPKQRKAVASVPRTTMASSRMNTNARRYTVEEGDTLFEIARRELGKSSRWTEIYDINRDQIGEDFDYLHPGTQLVLPTSSVSTPDPLTRQPSGTMTR